MTDLATIDRTIDTELKTRREGAAASVTEAAFGNGATTATPSGLSSLHPRTASGMAFYTGVAAIGLLYLIRRSLPN